MCVCASSLIRYPGACPSVARQRYLTSDNRGIKKLVWEDVPASVRSSVRLVFFEDFTVVVVVVVVVSIVATTSTALYVWPSRLFCLSWTCRPCE